MGVGCSLAPHLSICCGWNLPARCHCRRVERLFRDPASARERPDGAISCRPHSHPFVERRRLLGSPSAGARPDGSKGMFADEAARRMQRTFFFSPPPPQLIWQRRCSLKERKRMWQCGSLIPALFLLPWHGWLAACRIVTLHRSPPLRFSKLHQQVNSSSLMLFLDLWAPVAFLKLLIVSQWQAVSTQHCTSLQSPTC